MYLIDKGNLIKLLRERRNYLYKVWDENRDSPIANLHRAKLEEAEEVYWIIADTSPVGLRKVGRWELASDVDEGDRFWCSCCRDKGGTWSGPTPPPFEFCPHCGAEMEAVNDENN